MRHGFIGYGNLAKAIKTGLSKDKDNEFKYISKTNKYTDIDSANSLQELVDFADIIWLCVKPDILSDVLEELKNLDLSSKIIVSTIAGKSINFISDFLDYEVSIIRIMPNLAIAYSKSVTAICSNNKGDLFEYIKNQLSVLGLVVDIEEEKFDLFTAIYGSGPAFLLKFLEILYKETKLLDVDELEAKKMISFLLKGTVDYYDSNIDKLSFEELISKITSKGGTTQAGLECYKKNNIDEYLSEVIKTAEKRSQEL